MTTARGFIIGLTSLCLFTGGCAMPDDESVEPDLSFPDEQGGGDDGDGGDGAEETPAPGATPAPDPEPVPACDPGFAAEGSACALQGSSEWQIVIESATAPAKTDNGFAWDPFGGDPDAFVSVVFGPGVEIETAVVDNSLEPVWGEAVIGDARATELKSQFSLALYDEDNGYDDLIGECDLALPDAVFDGGTYSAADLDDTCPAVLFTLRNVD